MADANAKRIRTFSPVPKHVLNGSEDTDVLPAAVLSGAPIELSARTVRYVDRHRFRNSIDGV